MADNSAIQWTNATVNPIRARNPETGKVGWHCEVVSTGCANCYAARLNEKRFGTGLKYNAHAKPEVFLDDSTLRKVLAWKRPRKIFWCSMTDMFGHWVPDEWIDKCFAVMALTPQHTHQVLTKRPERMADWFRSGIGPTGEWHRYHRVANAISHLGGNFTPRELRERWPLPNVWLGTSTENQAEADKRIPHLLRCPAAVRFLSCEPLLGPIDLTWLECPDDECDTLDGVIDCLEGKNWIRSFGANGIEKPSYLYQDGSSMLRRYLEPYKEGPVSWVIVGGESGPGARSMTIGWAKEIVAQCKESGVPVFMKQLGSKPVNREGIAHPVKDSHGADWSEWPEVLRVREFPNV